LSSRGRTINKLTPQKVGQTAAVISRTITIQRPLDWASDPLSGFWDAAAGNVIANFVHDRPDVKRLRQVDGLLMRVAHNLIEPRNPLVALLLLRTHTAYRAASLLAMSGMPTDAYPLIRSVLEHAGYALLIEKNSSHGETWLRRQDGEKAKRIARKAFTPAQIKDLLQGLDKGLLKVFDDLYEFSIDFGAHPNERALTSNLSRKNVGSTTHYDVQYLHGDTRWVTGAIRNTARAGLFALYAFQHTMRAKFELLGVKDEMTGLRRVL
jgi:hypothetical protein